MREREREGERERERGREDEREGEREGEREREEQREPVSVSVVRQALLTLFRMIGGEPWAGIMNVRDVNSMRKYHIILQIDREGQERI